MPGLVARIKQSFPVTARDREYTSVCTEQHLIRNRLSILQSAIVHQCKGGPIFFVGLVNPDAMAAC